MSLRFILIVSPLSSVIIVGHFFPTDMRVCITWIPCHASPCIISLLQATLTSIHCLRPTLLFFLNKQGVICSCFTRRPKKRWTLNFQLSKIYGNCNVLKLGACFHITQYVSNWRNANYIIVPGCERSSLLTAVSPRILFLHTKHSFISGYSSSRRSHSA